MLLSSALVHLTLVAAALIGGQRAHVSATPTSTATPPSEWDPQDGARAYCTYASASNPPRLRFRLALRGFGSRAGAPGRALLERLRQGGGGDGAPSDGEWAARAERGTGADVSFSLPAEHAPATVTRVEFAVYEASGRRAAIGCHEVS